MPQISSVSRSNTNWQMSAEAQLISTGVENKKATAQSLCGGFFSCASRSYGRAL